MRWEDERYVRVYTRDTTDWLGLSFDAQALFLLLLRKVDRAGLLPLGKHGKRGVAIAVGHPSQWARLEPALEELLADGCVKMATDGGLVVPNFLRAQEARSSDKARQQKARELARDTASVTLRDISSQNVTENHTPSHAVTGIHDTSHAVTPSCAVPSRTDLPATQEPADAVPGRPPLILTEQHAGKKAKRPSAQQELYTNLQASRRERCVEVGEPWVEEKWPVDKQNSKLKAEVERDPAGRELFSAAWFLYLADDGQRVREPAWALSYFMNDGVRTRYETKAAREAA